MYRIADLTVEMHTFGRTLIQSEPYVCKKNNGECADIVIHSRWEMFQERYPYLNKDLSEYLSTGNQFYWKLLDHSGMMLHSSAVMVDGRVYLFSAPSGTGKSTHTALWLQYLGERAQIINDDKPAIRVMGDKVYVYGTPWSGKTNQNLNVRGELGGIAVVKRANENQIRRLSNKEAIFALLNQTTRSRKEERIDRLFEVIELLIKTIPIYELSCNMELEAAKVAYETMAFPEGELT
ncbi:hypothetical protein NDGK_01844 [Clostridiales bacterium CHKCI001]|nr:hypothetical protein NDGK_01844 [Clostridiales bacterium CHKCI001]